MARRRLLEMTLLAILALSPSGCLVSSPAINPLGISSSPHAESDTEADLPPRATAQVNLKLAENFEKTGHPEEAAAYYEHAREADPKLPGIAKRLALLYDRLGKTDQALVEFQAALKASPQDAEVLNGLGYFHYSRGQWDDAEKYLRQAIAADAKCQRAWVNLGMTLCQRQRYDEGFAAFTSAVSSAEAHSNVAFILTVQGKFEEARAEYRQALAANPNLTIARLALAKLERREASESGPR